MYEGTRVAFTMVYYVYSTIENNHEGAQTKRSTFASVITYTTKILTRVLKY